MTNLTAPTTAKLTQPLAAVPAQARAGGAAKPVWQSRGIVTNRLSLPLAQFAVAGDGSSKMIQEQSDFRACVDFSNATVMWENLDATSTDEKGPNTFNIKASIFNSSGNYGTISGRQPVPFTGGTESGRRSPNLAPGALVESANTGFSSTKSTRVVVRRELTATVAFVRFPSNEVARGLGDGDMVSRKGNTLDTGYVDTGDQAGGFYDNGNAPSAWCNSAPSAIIGDSTTRVARILSIGDSLVSGSGDTNNSETTLGFFSTALGNDYPSKRAGRGGYSLQALMADATKRAQLLASIQTCGITNVFVGTFTNDLSNGRTTAQIFADLAAFQAELNLLPLKPLIDICTAPPRTNAANNTPTASAAERLIFNTAVRAQSLYGWFDLAAWTQSAANNNLWDTTSGRGTSDGVHPNAATHAYIAAQLVSLLAALFSIARYA